MSGAINYLTLSPNQLTSTSDFNGYLTPDALMTYCQTRLQGIDSQVQQAFVQQEQANKTSSQISDLLKQLGFGDSAVTLNDVNGHKSSTDLAGNAAQILAAADGVSDPTVKAKLIDIAGKLVQFQKDGSGNPVLDAQGVPLLATSTGGISANDLLNQKSANPSSYADDVCINPQTPTDITTLNAQIIDGVKGIQSDISQSAELSMIGLQSLMSQRQEAIQLCTNLVQSMGDQCNKIAENVGK